MSDTLDTARFEAGLAPFLSAPRWTVALSGGVDSSVLLHLLRDFSHRHPGAPALQAVHVDHGMQPGSGDWGEQCAATCAALGVPLSRHRVDVSGGEAAAREARYGVFEAGLIPGEVLMLAHHRDDQVETVFLRLLRGAGAEGLAGMPASRALGAGELFRPLLHETREAIEGYARQRGIEFVEDPSNADTGIDRNYLRLEVLPLLEARWPAYRRTVSRASEHLAATVTALREELGVPDTVYSVAGDPGIAIDGLGRDGARAVRSWLEVAGYPPPDRSALQEFLRQLEQAGTDTAPRLDTGDYVLQVHRGAVYLLPDFEFAPPPGPVAIAPGQWRHVEGVGEVCLAATVPDGWSLDWRRGGERLRPAGRDHGTSLKKALQAGGLPPWWRDRVPLLRRGGDIIAVAEIGEVPTSPVEGGPPRLFWRPAGAFGGLPSPPVR